MKRRIMLLCTLFLCVCSLAGCGKEAEGGQSEAASGGNVAEIKKDGTITNVIDEELASEYYDEESLTDFIMGEAGKYNARAGEERVTVKKLEVKKEKASLTMEYKSAEDFSAFNGYSFFCGTIAEAYDKGYDLDVQLLDADAGGESITKEELLEMGSRSIVIVQLPADETLTVKTGGKILYQSGADAVKKDTAALSGSGTPVYLVYKS